MIKGTNQLKRTIKAVRDKRGVPLGSVDAHLVLTIAMGPRRENPLKLENKPYLVC